MCFIELCSNLSQKLLLKIKICNFNLIEVLFEFTELHIELN